MKADGQAGETDKGDALRRPARGAPRLHGFFRLVCWCALLTAYPAFAAPTESQLKAAFLYNFAQFVAWPDDAFASQGTPFSICVLGRDPFGPDLDGLVRGEFMQGRPIKVDRPGDISHAGHCHIIYISGSEETRLASIFEHLRGRSILTVGDTNAFGAQGGMIRFATVDNRVRLKIRVDAATAGKLNISSRLLRIADIVSLGGQVHVAH